MKSQRIAKIDTDGMGTVTRHEWAEALGNLAHGIVPGQALITMPGSSPRPEEACRMTSDFSKTRALGTGKAMAHGMGTVRLYPHGLPLRCDLDT